ncbi:MAG: PhoU domain-containing protein [Patescibacteria group bacterium]|nr:PhoU domain-containing protein [Patescibacteria group bacterium]
MSGKTQSMLHDSLDALVNLDANLAKDVCKRDDAVDKMKREIRVSAEEMIQQNPENTQAMLRIIAVARNLERIADCATNIAEDVIYMTEGGIVRHHESA